MNTLEWLTKARDGVNGKVSIPSQFQINLKVIHRTNAFEKINMPYYSNSKLCCWTRPFPWCKYMEVMLTRVMYKDVGLVYQFVSVYEVLYYTVGMVGSAWL